MKTLELKITGDYEVSNTIFKGTKKQVLFFLRSKALDMRMSGRQTILRKKEDWNKINGLSGDKKHNSELVNLASFQINQMGREQLLPLMNAHGVMTYEVKQ